MLETELHAIIYSSHGALLLLATVAYNEVAPCDSTFKLLVACEPGTFRLVVCEPVTFRLLVVCEPVTFRLLVVCKPVTFRLLFACEPVTFRLLVVCEPVTFTLVVCEPVTFRLLVVCETVILTETPLFDRGNWDGVLPYKQGEQCTACPDSLKCPNFDDPGEMLCRKELLLQKPIIGLV